MVFTPPPKASFEAVDVSDNFKGGVNSEGIFKEVQSSKKRKPNLSLIFFTFYWKVDIIRFLRIKDQIENAFWDFFHLYEWRENPLSR